MRNFLVKLFLLLVVLLGALYLAGILYFSDHFQFNTKINGLDVSLNSPENSNVLLSSKHPTITIIQKDKDSSKNIEEKIDLIDEAKGDIIYDSKDLLSSQNNLLWITSLFNNTELICDKVSGNIDTNELDKAIDKLYALQEKNNIEPIDAHYELKDGKLEIIKENDGCFIDKNIAKESIKTFIGEYLNGSGNSTLNLLSKYSLAKIKSNDSTLVSLGDNLQKVLDKNIEIQVNNSYTEMLNGVSLANLLSIENNEFKVNEDKLNEYAISLANKFDISSYEYIDKSALKSSLNNILTSDEDAKISLSWITLKKAHVEISISKQTLWYYEGDELLFSSPVVTGYGDTATPRGNFTLLRKVKDTTLNWAGQRWPVDRWMGYDPETGGHMIGFHDAKWRNQDEFGGDIYLSNPSHGCVNMPTDKAIQLFDLIDIGTEIHIYE